VASVKQAVVQRNGENRGVDEYQKGKDEEAPATPAVVPREWELGEQLGIGIVVFLEGSSATGKLGACCCAGVVVCRRGRAEGVGEATARVILPVGRYGRAGDAVRARLP
jgi:hypothetical protein